MKINAKNNGVRLYIKAELRDEFNEMVKWFQINDPNGLSRFLIESSLNNWRKLK